ncbi:MAG: sarcosine oxidase subunit delta family protein [Spiribacter sp.]|jgi:sarcosine oxidase, delta subunit family, heterotetrameric form|nr:sarcosine oxidase subunit delta family protein [Spiribacter sp.]
MLLIHCPWCGARDESEFSYGGEADIVRPPDPDAVDDAAWADYVFMRSNTRGLHREQWVHAHGCRRWFKAERDTVSYDIVATWPMNEERP